jgi:hypothetical protein
MYEVQEDLICVLVALLCTGLVFSLWIVLVLAQEGARALGAFARNAMANRGQMHDRNFASWREVVGGVNIVATGGGKSVAPPNFVTGCSDYEESHHWPASLRDDFEKEITRSA